MTLSCKFEVVVDRQRSSTHNVNFNHITRQFETGERAWHFFVGSNPGPAVNFCYLAIS